MTPSPEPGALVAAGLLRHQFDRRVLDAWLRAVADRVRLQNPRCLVLSARHDAGNLVLVVGRYDCFGRAENPWHFVAHVQALLAYASGVDCLVVSEARLQDSDDPDRRWQLTLPVSRAAIERLVSDDERQEIARQLAAESSAGPAPQAAGGFVYFIGDGEHVKIGRSRDNPVARMRALQTGSARKLSLLAVLPGADLESQLHRRFDHLRAYGEWFREAPELSSFIDGIRPATRLDTPTHGVSD